MQRLAAPAGVAAEVCRRSRARSRHGSCLGPYRGQDAPRNVALAWWWLPLAWHHDPRSASRAAPERRRQVLPTALRDLVPADHWGALYTARVSFTNYHLPARTVPGWLRLRRGIQPSLGRSATFHSWTPSSQASSRSPESRSTTMRPGRPSPTCPMWDAIGKELPKRRTKQAVDRAWLDDACVPSGGRWRVFTAPTREGAHYD